ncbi:MAG: MBL fold metallo-hydrolase [Synergistaceae bacterium]|nr:MBL fold metallo-hydrolase [Synergistaceae bacterium]
MSKIFMLLLSLVLLLVSSMSASGAVVEVISLLDVQGEGNTQLLIGASESQLKELLQDGKMKSQILAFFVKTPDDNILFDTGLRDGNIVKRLAENGIKPEDVKTILITHLHGDHFGGLVDADNNAAFPNASVYVNVVERAYWVDDVRNEAVINALNLYAGRVKLFNFGDEVLPGVKAIDASGHTPGHTAFNVCNEVLIVGDIMHFPEVQLPLPEVSVKYDVDPDQARESRKKILDYAAEKNFTIAGMHITPPGIYKIKKAGTGYEKF